MSTRHPEISRSRLLSWLAALAIVSAAAGSTGCSRTFYRRQADVDAYALVREKANHPHWRLENYTISVDPRSRMYDPYSIDCPPIPSDDPTAHQLMHCVDNKRGWPFWHDNGERPFVENPAWPEYIEVDERGVMRLDRDDAVRLALLQSREYQQQLETLYLSALDVSFERFRFDTQFFAGYQVIGEWFGRVSGGGESRSFLTASTFNRGTGASGPAPVGNRWGFAKTTSTGATLLAGFTNSLMWQFSGPDNYSSNTVLDFALVQPLLRGAGRERVMEVLTRSERNLLYNVRIMEQYRQAFYVDTLTGGGTQGSTTSRAGGVQGQGLTGFQGLGGSGFGNVQTTGGAAGTQAGAQGANNTAFVGLLQQQRLIRNQEDAIRRLRRNLTRLTTLLDEQPSEQTGAFLSQALQVAQSRQALLTQEAALVNARNQFQQDMDTFKVNELALPPLICIEPSDTLLDRFELIQQDIIRLPEDLEALLLNHSEVRREVPERIQSNVQTAPGPGGQLICRLQRYAELDDDLAKLKPTFADLQQFADQIVGEHLPTISQDLEVLRQAVPRRRAGFDKLIARIEELRQSQCELLPLGVDPLEAASGGRISTAIVARLDQSLADAERSYENLQRNFTRYAAALKERGLIVEELLENQNQTPEALFQRVVKDVFNPLYECGATRVLTIDIVEDMTRELVELQLLQGIVRTQAVELQEVDLRIDQALDVARNYRRDWMNARARLVDQWRLLEFNADQLQAGLDIIFDGDIGNVGDNPFNIRGDRGRLRAGVRFDAPLTRLGERNAYRQSLIEYQQARRGYYQFEDQVAQGLRGRLRSLMTFQINFELNRLAVLEAARQVMLNTFIDQEEQRTLTTRVTAARDAVQALTDLLNAQNQFMLVFISHEVQRLALDFNLGTMQLDSEGLWIDPGKIGADYGQYDPWLRSSMHGHGGLMGEEIEGVPSQPLKGDPLEQLPPAFMLPPGNFEQQPPAAMELPPLPGRRSR